MFNQELQAPRVHSPDKIHSIEIKSQTFVQICEMLSRRYSIPEEIVRISIQKAWEPVVAYLRKKDKSLTIENITCNITFQTENNINESVWLNFAKNITTFIDVIPYRKVDPSTGLKSDTAQLRICKSSYGISKVRTTRPYGQESVQTVCEDTEKAAAEAID